MEHPLRVEEFSPSELPLSAAIEPAVAEAPLAAAASAPLPALPNPVGTPKVGTSGWDASLSSSPACFRSSRAGLPRCSRRLQGLSRSSPLPIPPANGDLPLPFPCSM
jgi:hypothetical protein